MSDTSVSVGIEANDALAGAAVFRRAAEQISAAADKLERNVKGVSTSTKELGTTVKKTGSALNSIKGLLPILGVTTFGVALVGATKAALQFDKAMAEVSTLIDDSFGASVGELTEEVEELSKQFNQMPVNQAKALYQVISAGASDSAMAMDILTTANKLAVGGVTDVATAADGLTSVMNAYGLTAAEVADVSDAMFVAMKAGKTTIGELSASIGAVAPFAAKANVSIDELLATTAALTKGGLNTSEAMTSVRQTLQAIIKPSKDASSAAADLGIEFSTAGIKMAGGYVPFMQQVIEKTGGSEAAIARLFPQVQGLAGVLALTGEAGKSLGTIMEQMATKSGAAQEAVDKITASAEFQAQVFKGNVYDAFLDVGQAILRVLLPAIQLVNDNFEAMSDAVASVFDVIGDAAPFALAAGALYSLGAAVSALPAFLALATTGFWALVAVMYETVTVSTLLNKSLLLVAVAFAAWEFGKWLTQFESVQRAGYDMVGLFLIIVERIKYFSDASVLYIQKWAAEALNKFLEVRAAMQDYIADMDILPDSIQEAARAEAAALRSRIAPIEEYEKALSELEKQQKENIDRIKEDTKILKASVGPQLEMVTVTAKRAKSLEQLAKEMGTVVKEGKLIIPLSKQEVKAYATLIKTLDPLATLTKEYASDLALLKKAYANGMMTAEEYRARMDALTKAFNEQADEINGVGDALDDLLDKLDPVAALTKEFKDDQALLKKALELNKISTEEYTEAMEALTKQFEEQKKKALESENEAYPWGAAWEDAIKRIDTAFYNLWESAFNGFDGFMDAMTDALRTFAAQTFHNIFTKPIMDGMINLMKGGSFSSGTGGFGGGAGLLSYGADVYSGFSSGGFSGGVAAITAPFSSIGNWANTNLSGPLSMISPSFLNTGTSGVPGLNYAVAGDGGAALGSSINWTQVGGSIAAGFVGSYAGRMVFDNAGTTGIGSSAGAIVGAMIPVLGPILGAGIGAFVGEGLEKVLGDIFGFGGKPGNNIGGVNFDLGTGKREEFGIGNYNQENVTRSLSVVDAIEQFAETLGGSDLKGTIEASDRGWIRYNRVKYKNVDDLISQLFADMVDNATELEPGFKQVLKGFKGTTEETFKFAAAMLSTRAIIKSNGIDDLVTELEKQKNQTVDMIELYSKQSDEVLKLGRNFDGSVEGAVALNEALLVNRLMLLEMAAAVLTAKDNISEMIGTIIDGFSEQKMSYEEFVQDQLDQATMLYDEIETLSDPTKIQANTETIIRLWDNVYGSIASGLRNLIALSESLDQQFQSSITGFKKDTLSDSQMATYLEDEIQRLVDELPTLTNADDIQRTAQEINSLTNQLWNLIPDDEKLAKLGEFTTFLEDVNTIVQTMLTQIGEQLAELGGIDGEGMSLSDMLIATQDQFVEMLGGLEEQSLTRLDEVMDALNTKQLEINEVLGAALLDGAAAMQSAGNTQQSAASTLLTAARNFPRSITVKVNDDRSGTVTG